MFSNPKLRLSNYLFFLSGKKKMKRFLQDLHNPSQVQFEKLMQILVRNKDSFFGKKYHFNKIKCFQEYQKRVPISSYEDLNNYIDTIKRDGDKILTSEKVLMFEKTSGSSSFQKYIPYTNSLKKEFSEFFGIWLHDLYQSYPKLKSLKSYWSLSPISQSKGEIKNGIKVGFEDDSEYLSFIERILFQNILPTPLELKYVSDINLQRYLTLLYLIREDGLGFFSVWNPSFLIVLMEKLDVWYESLLRDLYDGKLHPPFESSYKFSKEDFPSFKASRTRVRELEVFFKNKSCLAKESIWPSLQLISCWTSAASKYFIPELKRHFPNVEIQSKGLVATEGVVSFPLKRYGASVLASSSHFYEFIDLRSNENDFPKLAHELEEGRDYSVLLTTSGGLYRYRIKDIIKVVGFAEKTPLIEFVGREGKNSDLCGEKLSEAIVQKLIDQELENHSLKIKFLMLAPRLDIQPYYTLYIQSTSSPQKIKNLTQSIEQRLNQSFHYNYCRRLEQLGPLKTFLVHEGAQEVYLKTCQSLGQKLGDIKATVLHQYTNWNKEFKGAYLN